MSATVTLEPVGVVAGGRAEVRDDGWAAETATLRLDAARFTAAAVAWLEDFSHLEVVFLFHRVAADRIEYGARRPRNNPG